MSLLMLSASAQTNKVPTPIIRPEVQLDKYHTIDELNQLNKGDLIQLYKKRFQVMGQLLPYIALTTKPGTTLKDLGIPDNSENKSLLEKEGKASAELDKSVQESLDAFIAYADKSNIVWAILFYEEIIRKILMGKDY
jgi:hypothetical protein